MARKSKKAFSQALLLKVKWTVDVVPSTPHHNWQLQFSQSDTKQVWEVHLSMAWILRHLEMRTQIWDEGEKMTRHNVLSYGTQHADTVPCGNALHKSHCFSVCDAKRMCHNERQNYNFIISFACWKNNEKGLHYTQLHARRLQPCSLFATELWLGQWLVFLVAQFQRVLFEK